MLKGNDGCKVLRLLCRIALRGLLHTTARIILSLTRPSRRYADFLPKQRRHALQRLDAHGTMTHRASLSACSGIEALLGTAGTSYVRGAEKRAAGQ